MSGLFGRAVQWWIGAEGGRTQPGDDSADDACSLLVREAAPINQSTCKPDGDGQPDSKVLRRADRACPGR